MANIDFQKRTYNKDYRKVLDTGFSQLVTQITPPQITEITVDDFFQLYSDLFYQIPKEGDVNSHTYLISKSQEYLGLSPTDVDALLAEITNLQQQLLDANQTINTLLKNSGS